MEFEICNIYEYDHFFRHYFLGTFSVEKSKNNAPCICDIISKSRNFTVITVLTAKDPNPKLKEQSQKIMMSPCIRDPRGDVCIQFFIKRN